MRKKLGVILGLVAIFTMATVVTVSACDDVNCEKGYVAEHDVNVSSDLFELPRLEGLALEYFLLGYFVEVVAPFGDVWDYQVYLTNPDGYRVNVYDAELTEGQSAFVDFMVNAIMTMRASPYYEGKELQITPMNWWICCGRTTASATQVASGSSGSHEVYMRLGLFHGFWVTCNTSWAVYRYDDFFICTGAFAGSSYGTRDIHSIC